MDYIFNIIKTNEFIATFSGVIMAFILNYLYSSFRERKIYKNLCSSIYNELKMNLKNYQYNYSAISFENFKRISGNPIFIQYCPNYLEEQIWDHYTSFRILKSNIEKVKQKYVNAPKFHIEQVVDDFKKSGSIVYIEMTLASLHNISNIQAIIIFTRNVKFKIRYYVVLIKHKFKNK